MKKDKWLNDTVKKLRKKYEFIGYYKLNPSVDFVNNYPKCLYACFKVKSQIIFISSQEYTCFHNTLGLNKNWRCYWEEKGKNDLNTNNMIFLGKPGRFEI